MTPDALLQLAADAARLGCDIRGYALGAAAERSDGAIVVARNGPSERPMPEAHAERRCLRKAGYGATVYVARVRSDGTWGLARPCARCMAALKARGVERVYFSTNRGYRMEWL